MNQLVKYARIIKLIVPPFLLNAILRTKNIVGLYEWKYVGNTWAEVNDKNEGGWDLEQIARIQEKKWNAYKEIVSSSQALGINHESGLPYKNEDIVFHNILMSYAYVLLLAARNCSKMKLLDWGGGIGHYGILSKYLLPTDVELYYDCYDLSSYALTSEKLWLNENINARFSADRKLFLNDKKYDLVFASSSIWYEPEWKNILSELAEVAENYIYITRMIFVKDAPSYVALQRPAGMGYKTSYHFWVLNEAEFTKYAQSIGLELIRSFVFSDKIRIYKSPENGKIKGFLFKKTKNNN